MLKPSVLAAVLLLLVPVSAASAAKPGTETAYFSLTGDAPPKAKKAVVITIKDALVRSGRKASGGGAPIDDTTIVLGCKVSDADCRKKVAATFKADELMYGSLDPVAGVGKAGGDLKLSLTLCASDGAIVAQVETVVPGTKLHAAGAVVDHLLERAEESTRGLLRVTSTPPGARVIISEKTVGTTPLELPMPLGSYSVAVVLGEAVRSALVEIVPGPNEVSFDLSGTAPTPGTPGKAKPVKVKGEGPRIGVPAIAVAGAGVLFLVAGAIVAATLPGVRADYDEALLTLPPPASVTEQEHLATLMDLDAIVRRGRTRAIVADVGFGIGGVALAAGVALAIVDLTKKKGSKPAASAGAEPTVRFDVAPRVGGAEASLRIRW